MPAPSIDYLNARRDLLPASGGTNYKLREHAKYASEDQFEHACQQADTTLGDFILWLDISGQVLYGRKEPEIDPELSIPF